MALANTTLNANGTNALSPFFADPSTIIQIHFTIISIGLLAVVFAYEYSNLETGTTYPYLSVNDFIMLVIGVHLVLSFLIYIPASFFVTEALPSLVLTALLSLFLALSTILLLSLLFRILSITELDLIEIHTKEAEFVAGKISVIDSRLVSSKRLLDKTSTGIPTKVTRMSAPKLNITAQDVGMEPGEYIVDVNLSKLEESLNVEGVFIHTYFYINIGHRISSYNETIAKVVDNEGEIEEGVVGDRISPAIETEAFDEIFEFNVFSKEYEPIYDFIEYIESEAKQSIDSRNISKLERCVYSYQSVFYSLSLSTLSGSAEPQRRVVFPILESLGRIFDYALKHGGDRDISVAIDAELSKIERIIIDQVFYMGLESRSEKFKRLSISDIEQSITGPAYFCDLLKYYKSRLENHPELEAYTQSRMGELLRHR